jgi:hypothetical protein
MTTINLMPTSVQLDDLYRTNPAAFYRALEIQSAHKAAAEAKLPSAERRRRTSVLFNRFVKPRQI